MVLSTHSEIDFFWEVEVMVESCHLVALSYCPRFFFFVTMTVSGAVAFFFFFLFSMTISRQVVLHCISIRE